MSDGAYDVIVVGSGVAGLTCALALADRRRVLVVTSSTLRSGSTPWAQGGVAASIGGDDSPLQHSEDTRVAGVDLCDRVAVDVLTGAAADAVGRSADAGVRYDLSPDGSPALTREGGHHRDRVLHAGGDATGAEVSRALVEAVLDSNVAVLEHSEVLDVALWERATARQVTGVVVQRAGSSSIRVLSARAVILATGGVGAVFRASTNPTEVAGDGLAIALRAGATLVDLEFVQFHPTGLRVVGIGQVPLISEALRGEGAVLRDGDGTPIMAGHHPLADLAPRDVVARQIDSVMSGGDGGDAGFVGLDATAFGVDVMRERFPTAYSICRAHGIDPARELIPVAPVQHFMCGGIRTDSVGATDVPGLYAVGECAATGVHGANRLASNSLLEGMVFGARVARELTATLPSRREAMPVAGRRPVVPDAAVPEIRSTMSGQVGVRRSGPGLAAADVALRGLLQPAGSATSHRATNRWTVAAAIVAGATARRESRGCHWRADHPGTSAAWRHRVAVRLDESGLPVAEPDVALVRSA